ncbi:Probable inactive receptor kinase [Striga hermonthica]|uniref:Probable inactive receptor kinase n=1 Tax=Striga hermonthica TaxID=68872 RepID=A0A9N7R0J9_STRHE|nr:Probable inactive receptor kinase [Striga hermonthica]
MLLLLLFSLLPAAIPADLSSDRAALLALRSALGGRSFLWNDTSPTPCAWQGVRCDGDRVVVLRLPASSLSGALPANTISNLTSLRTLSLRLNHLSGPLPDDLSRLSQLRNLYLQGNQFTGPLPDSILSLHALPLDTVCAGNAGPTESPAEAPNGNVDFGGETGKKKKKLSGGAIAGIVVGSFVGLILLVLALFILCRKRNGNNVRSVDVTAIKNHAEEPHEKPVEETNSGVSNGFSVSASAVNAMGANGNTRVEMGTNSAASVKKLVFFGNASRIFDLEELLRASAEVLGKGTFGTSYKAVLEVGTVVAVKRLKDVTIGEREFREKIEAVGAMDHENLVPLRAYYYSREEKLLVFDYMPMGSLSAVLHGNKGSGKNPLNWETRLAIALGAARVDLPRWVQSVVRDEWTSEVFDVELVRYNNLEEEMVQLLQLGIGCTAQYPDSRPSISEVVRRIEGIHISSLRGYQDETDHVSETY